MWLVRWPLAAAGLLLGLAPAWTVYQWSAPDRWAPDFLAGAAAIVCGLIVSARRREGSSGDLLLATGFAWFVPNLTAVAPAGLAQLAAFAVFLHRGPLVHLLLSYPGGRGGPRVGRGVVAAGYVLAVAYPVWQFGPAEVVLAGGLAALAIGRYAGSVGPARRGTAVAALAAVAVSSVFVSAALAPAGFEETIPLVYDAVIAGVAIGFAAALLLPAADRSAVADIVVELGTGGGGSIRDALSWAMSDPTVEVGYWLPEVQRFVDAQGNAVESPPEGDPSRSATVIEPGGLPVALLVHSAGLADDPALIQALAAAAKLSAANARLQMEVLAQVQGVEASRRRILRAADEERDRLEHRLREGAQSRLARVAAALSEARRTAAESATAAQIASAEEQLTRTKDEMSRLARGIHPRGLSDGGLHAALTELTRELALPVDLAVSASGRAPSAAACAYFICSEALSNMTKYARASKATVSVSERETNLVVEVTDDGVGGARLAAGTGLRGLVDRVEVLGGTLELESSPGRGPRIVAVIPNDA